MHNSSHDYSRFAKAYAALGVEDTYYLAYRDIPELVKKYYKGKLTLDYGCGSGRSTRFLKELGLDVVGIDISPDMIYQAQELDPSGAYRILDNAGLPFEKSTFDLVFQSIVAMEFPTRQILNNAFAEIQRVLKSSGIAIMITNSPGGYAGEWCSFIKNFPENQNLVSGEQAKCIIRKGNIILYDYVWLPEDFKQAFDQAGLSIAETQHPLAVGNEPYKWHDELTKPGWDIYVLKK